MARREMGEVQTAYIESFKTFEQDFSYRVSDPTIATSVSRLTAWYTQLDADLKSAVSALSDDDIQNRIVERGFQLPLRFQLNVYQEALLIFYGKCSVYLKAMGKPLDEQWAAWIA